MRAWLLWLSLGLWHGMAAYFIPLHALAPAAAGGTPSVHVLGTAVMTSVLVIVTLRVRVFLFLFVWFL